MNHQCVLAGTRRVTGVACGTFYIVLLLVSQPVMAQGQADSVERHFPGYGVAEPAPFLGFDGNPAGLAGTDGELSLYGGNHLIGGGLGLSLGALKLGIGLDWLMLSGPVGDALRFDFGLALALGPSMALAWQYQEVWGDSGDGVALHSVGLLARPARWLSLGFSTRNIAGATLGGDATTFDSVPGYSAGLAIRPYHEYVTLGAEMAGDYDGDWLKPSGYLAWNVVPGLRVAGSVAGVRGPDSDWSLWFGGALTLGFDHTEAYAGGWADKEGNPDVVVGMRFSTESPRTVMSSGGRMVRLTLGAMPESRRASFFGPTQPSLLDRRMALEALARDDRVSSVLLIINPMDINWPQAQELGLSIKQIRDSGKRIIAYVYQAGNKEYYLASFADKILMHPSGIMTVTGIRSTIMFWADTLSLIGIKAQFVRIGKYKSYPEVFTDTDPSPEFLEVQNNVMNQVYTQWASMVATNRHVDPSRVDSWVNAGPQTPTAALGMGMVDGVVTAEEMPKALTDMGYPKQVMEDGYPFDSVRPDRWDSSARVAVVVVEGTIVDGRSAVVPIMGTRLTGGETLVEVLNRLASSSDIDAVLIRVDSPGGAALAPDRVYHAIRNLADKKPVVVSMGGTAASAAYYLSSASPYIFAMPGTVTGSIGIFYGKFITTDLFDRLLIHRVHIQKGDNAAWNDMDYEFTEKDMEAALSRITEYYNIFVARVAAGRGMSVEEVNGLGQGRVWTGAEAVERRLVDEIGGSLEALNYLRGKIGLDAEDPISLVYYPTPGFGDMLASVLGSQVDGDWLESIGSLFAVHVWAIDPFLPRLTF